MSVLCKQCRRFKPSKHFTQECQKPGGVCHYEGPTPSSGHFHDYYKPPVVITNKNHLYGCGFNLTPNNLSL